MKRVFLYLCIVGLVGSICGCRRHLSHPEEEDPVYLDMQQRAEKLLINIADAQKDVDKDRVAFDSAPIRTGQRQDARDDYFEAQKKVEKLIETYRFQALRVERQRRKDRTEYEAGFKAKKAWPNPQEIADYKIEMKAAETPKEWNPDALIKKREPAQEKPAQSEGDSEK